MALDDTIVIKCLCCNDAFPTTVGAWAICKPCREGECKRCPNEFRVDPCR